MLHSWQVMTCMTNIQRSGTVSMCVLSAEAKYYLAGQISLGEAVQKHKCLQLLLASNSTNSVTSIKGVRRG